MKFAYIVELYRLNYNFKRKFQREDWLSNIKEKNSKVKFIALVLSVTLSLLNYSYTFQRPNF